MAKPVVILLGKGSVVGKTQIAEVVEKAAARRMTDRRIVVNILNY